MQKFRGLQRKDQRGCKRGNSQPPDWNSTFQSIPSSSTAYCYGGDPLPISNGSQANMPNVSSAEIDRMSLDPSPVSVRNQQKCPASSDYTSFLENIGTNYQPTGFSSISYIEVNKEPVLTKLNYETLKPLRPRRIQVVVGSLKLIQLI